VFLGITIIPAANPAKTREIIAIATLKAINILLGIVIRVIVASATLV